MSVKIIDENINGLMISSLENNKDLKIYTTNHFFKYIRPLAKYQDRIHYIGNIGSINDSILSYFMG